jgi:predicted N-formylglutamate amidohydrolase
MPATLLGPGDPAPVEETSEREPGPFLVTVDHAGNAVPAALDDLGLPPDELGRHIGIDQGALAVARGVGERLGCGVIWQPYSRLVIDCNRRPGQPGSIPEISDGTAVPGNRGLDMAARQAREREILGPYHARIMQRLCERAAAGRPTIYVAMHSFTPVLRVNGTPRPWQVGLCWGRDSRFSRLVVDELRRDPALTVGVNEPYRVEPEVDFGIPVHAEARGLPYAEFEVRQDLIADAAAADAWAERLAAALRAAAARFLP